MGEVKRAVFLHGTDGSPDKAWVPWLKEQLESRGYEVYAPLLPNNDVPNRITYNDFLFGTDWDFTDNLLIGHSSGAVEVLNLLDDERSQKVRAAVLVGVWADCMGTVMEGDLQKYGQIHPRDGFDFSKIKQNASQFLYIHGDDDPYCPLDQARWLCGQTGGDLVIIPGGKHLSPKTNPQYADEFPQLVSEMEKRGIL